MALLQTTRGRSLPLGATALADGVNFSLLCRHGTAVTLVLYPIDAAAALAEIALDPHRNRTGDHWHILVAGLPRVFRYGWRSGRAARRRPSLRSARSCCSIRPPRHFRRRRLGPSGRKRRRQTLRHTDRRSFSFAAPSTGSEDAPPLTPLEDTIIYELHVRGFTCHPSSGVAHPGTFAGLIEKIPYLQASWASPPSSCCRSTSSTSDDCPFTNPHDRRAAAELLGLQQHRLRRAEGGLRRTGARSTGRSTNSARWSAPSTRPASKSILDVVFNHTGEGDDRGRTYSFRGLDNELYYLLAPTGAT